MRDQLVRGRNVLAVEVHLSSASDADLFWDAELTYTLASAGVAPTITAQPQGRTVAAGDNVDFSVTATGTAPLQYQWLRDGAPLEGATGSTLALANVQPSQEGTSRLS